MVLFNLYHQYIHDNLNHMISGNSFNIYWLSNKKLQEFMMPETENDFMVPKAHSEDEKKIILINNFSFFRCINIKHVVIIHYTQVPTHKNNIV